MIRSAPYRKARGNELTTFFALMPPVTGRHKAYLSDRPRPSPDTESAGTLMSELSVEINFCRKFSPDIHLHATPHFWWAQGPAHLILGPYSHTPLRANTQWPVGSLLPWPHGHLEEKADPWEHFLTLSKKIIENVLGGNVCFLRITLT